ncbi:hypothetical protein ACWDTT_10425 [Streptosporangium sandarakinum]
MTHHPNLGNFEWIEFEVGAETELNPGETIGQALDRLDAEIAEHLQLDLERVTRITANDRTYVDELVERPRRRREVSRG